MRTSWLLLICSIATIILFAPRTTAQTTEFTYQGRLLSGGLPANGSFDFEFRLFDDVAVGTQLGPTVPLTSVNVVNGVFSVRIDFGDQFPGASRFLEIRVRQAGDQLFTVLSPRQAITSAPYAIKSLHADDAVTASNTTQLGGVVATQYIQTTDGRLSDARDPKSGSANYIQNTTSQQAASNFNISGNGFVAGRLTSSFITTNQVSIATDTPAALFHLRVNSGNLLAGNAGCSPGFTGIGFGTSFSACTNYSLLGNGSDTMINRPTGGRIFLREANADQMTIAPGGNVGIGTTTPQQRLQVDGNEVLSTGFQSGFKFRDRGSISANDDWVWYSAGNIARLFHAGVGDVLTVQTNGALSLAGSSNFSSSVLNAATQFNLGGQRVLSAAGNFNLFAGVTAGTLNTTGSLNAFFGAQSGAHNVDGSRNTFVGTSAGLTNTSGNDNSFFGTLSGLGNTTGRNNSFFGSQSGQANTTGFNNSFFGYTAGINNTTGANNSFYGFFSGFSANVGGNNSFFGANAGFANTSGSNNAFFGTNAGAKNTASGNAFFGGDAGSANVIGNGNAFFGANAGNKNTASGNSFFGSDAGRNNVTGIGNAFFGSTAGLNNTATGNSFFGFQAGLNNSTGAQNSFFGNGAGFANTIGDRNAFFGSGAGFGNTTGASNSFFGDESGGSNSTGFNNSLFGYRSGANIRDGSLNAFFGYQAGANNLSGNDNAFFGSGAGQNSTADNNSFFGGGSGFSNTVGFDNTFIGKNAGFKNLNGNGNAFLGANSGLVNTSGSANTFLGVQAGQGNLTGQSNVFIGGNAGQTNVDGFDNTVVGTLADVASTSLVFATAIGAGAVVSTNNTIQLGRTNGSDRVRISGLGTAGTVALCRNANNEVSTCSSSRRYKFNINPFTAGLDLIKRLQPVSFQWHDGGMRDIGLVAEDVYQVEPLLTTTNQRGEIEGVKYDRIGVVLITSIKQQQLEIQAQQKRIEDQEATIKQQQLELEALKQLVCGPNPRAEVCRSRGKRR